MDFIDLFLFWPFLPIAAAVVALPFILSLWREYTEEKRVKQMEIELPAVLEKISTLPATISFTEMMAIFSTGKTPLAVEFKTALAKIGKGMPCQVAINEMQFSNSIILQQAKRLLCQLYTNGFPALPVLKEFGEQVSASQEVAREAEASNSLQKYSLLVSSAFLVPLILALLYSISLRASSLLSFLASSSGEVQSAVFLSVNIYLVIFSLLVSIFLARQAGKAKSFITYFFSSTPLSLLVFHVAIIASSNLF